MYRAPRWKNVGITMLEKAKIFVTDAGKVIIMISLLLWFLSSYGPSEKMDQLNAQYAMAVKSNPTQAAQLEKQYNTDKLANSYAGILGKKIEPVMIIFCSSSLTSPVRRLREYWKVYEGDNAFEFVKLLTGFDLLSYFKQEDKLIREIMDKIFDMM